MLGVQKYIFFLNEFERNIYANNRQIDSLELCDIKKAFSPKMYLRGYLKSKKITRCS